MRDVSSPKHSLDAFAAGKLAAAAHKNRRRRLINTARASHMRAGELISFTDNDYLGLSTDPRLIEAAEKAARDYGAGSGASRLVTGNHPLYAELEAKLAALKGTESAIVFGSGYMANSGIIPAVVGRDDLIIADRLIHTSLHAGIKLSGATSHFAPHNDVQAFEHLLASHRHSAGHALIVVDGVYSMDGDTAPLGQLNDLAQRYNAWLLVDDAHGMGVLGDGRGTAHQYGVANDIPLLMGTLSKSVGAYGGYLAASKAVCDLMVNRARSLIYTTGLPPATIAAAIAGLDIIASEPERCARPMILAKRFTDALGLAAPASPLVPIQLGSDLAAVSADLALRERGFRVTAFRPPTVPEGTARLRVSFSASHREADVDALITAIKDLNLLRQNGA